MHPAVFIFGLLVAPISAVAGLLIGAQITHRMMRGLPPVPTPIAKARVVAPPEETKKRKLPEVRA